MTLNLLSVHKGDSSLLKLPVAGILSWRSTRCLQGSQFYMLLFNALHDSFQALMENQMVLFYFAFLLAFTKQTQRLGEVVNQFFSSNNHGYMLLQVLQSSFGTVLAQVDVERSRLVWGEFTTSADKSHFHFLHNDWLPRPFLGPRDSCCPKHTHRVCLRSLLYAFGFSRDNNCAGKEQMMTQSRSCHTVQEFFFQRGKQAQEHNKKHKNKGP